MDEERTSVTTEASEWLGGVIARGAHVFVKRLSANDTGATGSHQVGPYLPLSVVKVVWPALPRRRSELNPKVALHVEFRSHQGEPADAALTWYNNKLFGGTRNEFRLTNWGGRSAPVQDAGNTGAIFVLAVSRGISGRDEDAEAWVCRNDVEEDSVEAVLGPVEPGGGSLLSARVQREGRCALAREDIPPEWLEEFPRPERLVTEAITRCGGTRSSPDSRLITRRACEFALFESVEREHVLPKIAKGFRTVDEFVALAGEVTNRRKSRSGRSLELHLLRVFSEEGLHPSHGEISEGKKRPDFLFPSAAAYRNRTYPEEGLRMLAAKTTVKDRWRQILNEAHRVKRKHLLTLQQGVSTEQFAEMQAANVTLVVPASLHRAYPGRIRPHLVTLERFIREVRELV